MAVHCRVSGHSVKGPIVIYTIVSKYKGSRSTPKILHTDTVNTGITTSTLFLNTGFIVRTLTTNTDLFVKTLTTNTGLFVKTLTANKACLT